MTSMPRERKILLAVFFSILVIAAIFLVSNVFLPEFKKLNRQIEENNKAIEELSGSIYKKDSLETRVKILESLIEAKKAKFYDKGETTPFLFANMIKDQLQKHGLAISNFQMVSMGNDTVPEFTIKGATYDFIRFIETIYARKNGVRIPFLRISAEKDGTCLVNMRIGYEEN